MGLLDKIKGLLGKNKKAAAGAVDKVADVAQKVAPDSVDDKIEAGAEKVKDVIENLDDK
ncbi:MAG TPA: antitoxin [Acidimicrobiaceae bacterium]|nr:antitoxin [Acidimicrobiaceae bacterium]